MCMQDQILRVRTGSWMGPSLGALPPRGGPVQDPVLTLGCISQVQSPLPELEELNKLRASKYAPAPQPSTPHPIPYTLHPTPYTLLPAPYTLHPTPYILHPAPCTLYPTS